MLKTEKNFYTNSHYYTFEPSIADIEHSTKPLFTNDITINRVNLNRIIIKSMDPYSGYAWDPNTAFQLANLYRAFLFLCKTYPKEVIVPTKEVDDFWHLHILDTRNYIIDCFNVFGYYLHHYPYAGLTGSGSTKEDEERFKVRTLELVEKHFPQLLSE